LQGVDLADGLGEVGGLEEFGEEGLVGLGGFQEEGFGVAGDGLEAGPLELLLQEGF
jgi:hypothetical protein